jgi:imidazolonepropionase-like amidohydrolase
MGVIAFVRQSFLDARHYQLAWARYERSGTGQPRPSYDSSLSAMRPALEGTIRVAFEADSTREIDRALGLARELKLAPVISGGREAHTLSAELKAANVPVLVSLNFPVRLRSLAPDADEPIRVLRERASAPRAAAALEKAGILYAFQSHGLKEPKDFLKNASKAVREGLPRDAAVRALTLNAARIAGIADRLGSIERGKIANLIVTDGDLFDEKTKIRHVFVDGRLVPLEKDTKDSKEAKKP